MRTSLAVKLFGHINVSYTWLIRNREEALIIKQNSYMDIIQELTERALWEVNNVMDCVPDDLWDKCYCAMPMWKHIYHMLHSLDLWFINPRDNKYKEPSVHEKDLNNLDVISDKELSRDQIRDYYSRIKEKTKKYLYTTDDDDLLLMPENCEYTRFTLILSQYRHLHSHMGMIMGFIIADTGLWPRVVGLEKPIPHEPYNKYF